MPRPSKLNPERHAEIVRFIRGGSYANVAARASGISEAAFYAWMDRGRGAERDDDGNLLNPDDLPYVEFQEAVKEAEAAAEVQSVALIRQAANNGTWQAAAWYLERKYPDRFGRKDHLRQEVTGPNAGPVEISAKEQLAAFLLARRDPETAEPLPAEEGTP